MRSTLRKTLIGSIASLAIGVAAVCSSAPASAQIKPGGGGGWHGGGGGGWHGGGGGGWHGGGGGWHGGGGGWNHRGGGWGGYGLGLGLLGLGALGYGSYYGAYGNGYGDGYDYDSGCLAYRPVYDQYGRYLGRRPVNVC